MSDRTVSDPEPPSQLRLRYYLWDVRLPATWLPWVARDIASPAWLGREIARFLGTFLVLAAVFGRLRLTLPTAACLTLGVAGIVAGRRYLREVALAYQRYGWDWGSASRSIGQWIRIGYAILFTVVFLILVV